MRGAHRDPRGDRAPSGALHDARADAARHVGAAARAPRLRAAAGRWPSSSACAPTTWCSSTTPAAASMRCCARSSSSRATRSWLTDHAYGGVARAAAFIARRARRGGRDRRAAVSAARSGGAASAVARAITPRTRLAVLDHVESETALVMPRREDGRGVPRARRAGAGGRRARAGPDRARHLRRSASTGTPPTCTSGASRRAAAASCGPRRSGRRGCIPP